MAAAAVIDFVALRCGEKSLGFDFAVRPYSRKSSSASLVVCVRSA